ncbi:hypothetical protein MOSE0_E05182 [Monosporozyma servazzii]
MFSNQVCFLVSNDSGKPDISNQLVDGCCSWSSLDATRPPVGALPSRIRTGSIDRSLLTEHRDRLLQPGCLPDSMFRQCTGKRKDEKGKNGPVQRLKQCKMRDFIFSSVYFSFWVVHNPEPLSASAIWGAAVFMQELYGLNRFKTVRRSWICTFSGQRAPFFLNGLASKCDTCCLRATASETTQRKQRICPADNLTNGNTFRSPLVKSDFNRSLNRQRTKKVSSDNTLSSYILGVWITKELIPRYCVLSPNFMQSKHRRLLKA